MRALARTMALAMSVCLLAGACTSSALAEPATSTRTAQAPEFQGIDRWINSAPLTMQQLGGEVVLVEFWTYSCINCIHVMPYVKRWHERYQAQGLRVVGVHSPEYDEERLTANVQAAVKRFGIEYPVAQDNGFKTWDAYGNRFWPAMYLIDRDGRIVYRHYGEGDYDVTEARIRELLSQR